MTRASNAPHRSRSVKRARLVRQSVKRIQAAAGRFLSRGHHEVVRTRRLGGAVLEIIMLLPSLYREYRRFHPRGLRNKTRTVRRIARLTYTHKLKSILPNRLTTYLHNLRTAPRRLRRTMTRVGSLGAAVVVLVASMILPAMQARATTLTWTNNSDFAMNQPGKCQPTTLVNIQMAGVAYDDQACAATGVDTDMRLKSSGTNLANVKSAVGGLSALACAKK